ncbi:hypothetical protein BCR35DRAFT_348878 [Leucosporidium creatinivorum]|uniref:NAD-dependent epimerase/dehydratase domain-containing protein n=1 Tax=Leucosporidium creatinivorum TaxID=106004 RepID=A0A1Y2G4P0_9BASI|nr:hypothetical protein BCR35DRAFT_348878 [Leucosporidium creatinivorum]
MSNDIPPLMLITGSSGFVGSEIAFQALKQGLAVRLVFRKPSQAEAWEAAYGEYKERTETVVVQDFAVPGAFDEAVKGVSFIAHAATPINFHPKDNKRDVLDPAIDGLLGLLKSAQKAPSVKAFVYTSSIAAYADLTKPFAKNEVLTEKHFVPFTYDQAAAFPPEDGFFTYSASKELSEKPGQEFMNREKPSFTFTTIAPTLVLGEDHQVPLTWEMGKSVSSLAWAFGAIESKKYPSSIGQSIDASQGSIPFVNVVDVARAHTLAAQTPIAAGKRYGMAAGYVTYEEIGRVAAEAVPDHAYCWPHTEGKQAEPLVHFESSTVEKDLGFKYIGLEETVASFARQMFSLPGAPPPAKAAAA